MMKIGLGLLIAILMSCHCDKLGDSYTECITSAPYPKFENEDYLEYYNQKIKWNCLRSTDYTFTYRDQNQGCYGTEITLVIENNEIIAAEYFHPYPDFFSTCLESEYLKITMDDILYEIESALDSSIILPEWLEQPSNVADQVRIEYDPLYGYPVDVFIDYKWGWADEEWSIEVLEFTYQ